MMRPRAPAEIDATGVVSPIIRNVPLSLTSQLRTWIADSDHKSRTSLAAAAACVFIRLLRGY